MKRTEIIYKTRLTLENIETSPIFTLELPYKSEILGVQMQESSPVIWYKFQTADAERIEKRIIEVVGTGQEFDSDFSSQRIHLGTVLIQDGFLVLHFFEVK